MWWLGILNFLVMIAMKISICILCFLKPNRCLVEWSFLNVKLHSFESVNEKQAIWIHIALWSILSMTPLSWYFKLFRGVWAKFQIPPLRRRMFALKHFKSKFLFTSYLVSFLQPPWPSPINLWIFFSVPVLPCLQYLEHEQHIKRKEIFT